MSSNYTLYLWETENFPLSKKFLQTVHAHSSRPHNIVLIAKDMGSAARAEKLGISCLAQEQIFHQNNPAGCFVVSTEAFLPPHWDKLLKQTASADDLCGTASPLPVALFPDCTKENALDWNRFLWAQKEKIAAETERCAAHCFYLTPQALCFLHEHQKTCPLKDLDLVLRQNGFIHLVCANLLVPLQQTQGRSLSVQETFRFGPALLSWRHMLLDKKNQGISYSQSPAYDRLPVQLHVIHGWGGGLEKWCRDFCDHDTKRCNLILRPVGTWGSFGRQLELYASLYDPSPLASWPLFPSIRATDIHHAGYKHALQEILTCFSVESILVSSLIGHSLDILGTVLPTMQVVHDYHPFCPKIIADCSWRPEVRKCGFEQLTACLGQKGGKNFFQNVSAAEWQILREHYFSCLQEKNIGLTVPTAGAKEHLQTLDERYKQVPITVLAHGDKPLGYEPTKVKIAQKKNAKKNTIVVLGELRPEKGAGILKSIAPKLLETADIHVLGYGDNELDLPGNGLHVLKRYKESELGTILQAINPDLGLLLSTWPETYSYTLSELIQAQIPVVATNLGSFADRIKHGVTGYLCPTRPQDVSAQIRKALDNPDELQQIRTNLKNVQLKSVGQMVEEYQQRLPVPPREPVRILPDFRLGPVTNQLPLDVPADFLPFGNYVDFSISYLREKHAELHKKSRIKGLIIRTVLTGFRVLRKIQRLTS